MKWILASAMPSLCSTPRHRRYEGVIHNAALWETSTPCGGDYNAALWGNSWAFFVGRTMNIITYQHWPLAIDQYTYKQVQEEASYYSIGSIAAASYRESMLRGYDGYVHTTCSIFSLWTLSYYVYVSARDTPITRLYQGLCG